MSKITDAMVEAALLGAMGFDSVQDDDAPKGDDYFRGQMRAALEAAWTAGLTGRKLVELDDGEYVMRHFGLDIDHEAGGVYVSLNHNPVARTQPWGDDVNVDYDKDGTPTGVEVLRPRVSGGSGASGVTGL